MALHNRNHTAAKLEGELNEGGGTHSEKEASNICLKYYLYFEGSGVISFPLYCGASKSILAQCTY